MGVLHQGQESVAEVGQDVSVRELTLRDLDVHGTIGVGYVGRVRLVKTKRHCCEEQAPFALKSMSKRKLVDCGMIDHVLAEKNVLNLVEHPFILRLFSSFHDEQSIHLLTEYVNGSDLSVMLEQTGRFGDDQARLCTLEVALGIGYLHSMNILHRDLKPDNLMVDDAGHIKIVDFGFARIVEGTARTVCGNPNYMAPELVQSRGYGTAADWWSLGILVHELLDGYPPFCAEDLHVINGQFLKYFRQRAAFDTFPRHFNANAQTALSSLLTYDPSDRAGLEELKRLDWFEGIPWCAKTLMQCQLPFGIGKKTTNGVACRAYPDEEDRWAPVDEEEQKLFDDFGYRAWSTDVRLSSDVLQAMSSLQGELDTHVSRTPKLNETPSTTLETDSVSAWSDILSCHSSGTSGQTSMEPESNASTVKAEKNWQNVFDCSGEASD